MHKTHFSFWRKRVIKISFRHWVAGICSEAIDARMKLLRISSSETML